LQSTRLVGRVAELLSLTRASDAGSFHVSTDSFFLA
jgi:hypothetical protein